MRPTIATFNEATLNFYKMLQRSEWVQKEYWVSPFEHVNENGSFNVIIARIPPIFCRKIVVEDLPREILTFYFLIKRKFISVSSTHLTSLAKNHERRKNQLIRLKEALQIDLPCVQIIQGDLNIHSEEENGNIQKVEFRDSWLEKHNLEEDPGFTFDGEKNSLIHEVYWGW